MYTELNENNIFEQLMLAVACFASHRPASGEVSISDVTWRRVKVERSVSLSI